jgi:hypothetical protein
VSRIIVKYLKCFINILKHLCVRSEISELANKIAKIFRVNIFKMEKRILEKWSWTNIYTFKYEILLLKIKINYFSKSDEVSRVDPIEVKMQVLSLPCMYLGLLLCTTIPSPVTYFFFLFVKSQNSYLPRDRVGVLVHTHTHTHNLCIQHK